MCFQGEQNKQLQRNLNALHVNSFLPQSHVSAEIIVRLLMKDSRLMPDDLIIVCLQEKKQTKLNKKKKKKTEAGAPEAAGNELDEANQSVCAQMYSASRASHGRGETSLSGRH